MKADTLLATTFSPLPLTTETAISMMLLMNGRAIEVMRDFRTAIGTLARLPNDMKEVCQRSPDLAKKSSSAIHRVRVINRAINRRRVLQREQAKGVGFGLDDNAEMA
jgi:hypothetical protein